MMKDFPGQAIEFTQLSLQLTQTMLLEEHENTRHVLPLQFAS
jgi:hypothetical protein